MWIHLIKITDHLNVPSKTCALPGELLFFGLKLQKKSEVTNPWGKNNQQLFQ